MLISISGFAKRIFPFIIGFSIFLFSYNFSNGNEIFFLRLIVSLIFIYSLYKGMIQKTLINPYILFSLTPLSIMLYNENISYYYLNELNNSTWILVIINMLAFLIGINLVVSKKRLRNLKFKKKSKISTIEKNKLIKHSIILFVISKIPLVFSFANIEIPFRTIFDLFYYFSLALAFKAKNRKLIISLLLLLFISIESLNKTFILFLTISFVVFFEKYYFRLNKKIITTVITVIILITFMIMVAFPLVYYYRLNETLRGFNLNKINPLNYFSPRVNWNFDSQFFLPYMYLVTPWNNLQYILDTQNTRTYGAWFLKPIFSYLQIDKYFERSYELTPYSSFNTFSFITVQYKDFGYIGSIFPSIFLGLFVGNIYYKYLINDSPFIATSFAFASAATLQMFFSNHFFQLSYPFTVLVIAFVYEKIFYKKL